MRPLAPGDRVLHSRYGFGTVEFFRNARRALVRFDRHRLLPRTVPLDELIPAEQAATGASLHRGSRLPDEVEGPETGMSRPGTRLDPTGEAPVAEKAVAPSGRVEKRTAPPATRPESGEHAAVAARLRQAVEALRLGVVPAYFVGDYTVGRGPEIERVRALLGSAQGLLLIWGEYGAGKTHMLDLAEQQALAVRYVTARVILDPAEVPPSHPQRLYTHIVRSLRYPGQVGRGVEPLLEALERSVEHLEEDRPRFSRFLAPALFARSRGDHDLQAWTIAWLEGQPMDPQQLEHALRAAGWSGPRLLALSDFRTYGRVYVHILGALAAWLKDAGFRGLLVLCDEVERIDALDAEQRRFALEVLKHYAAATLPGTDLAFAEDDLYRGGHEVHRELSLRYEPDQPLVVLMTLTPLSETLAAVHRMLATRAHEISLPPLGPRELAELVERVIDLYRRAYPEFRPRTLELEPVRRALARQAASGEDKPREMIRRVVASLDALRYRSASQAA
jgi:hypothetical protein